MANADGEHKQVLTQRKLPRMALVKLSIVDRDENGNIILRFSAPDMPNFDIVLPLKHQMARGTDTILTAKYNFLYLSSPLIILPIL